MANKKPTIKTIKKTAKTAPKATRKVIAKRVVKKSAVLKKSQSRKIEAKPVRKAVTKKEVSAKVSAPVFDLTGKKKGTVSLPTELFGGKINEQLMAQAVRVYLANQRQGSANTKTRSEVTGSRRKVWRQKGTGRARHGSITGPIFVGGGIIHGPRTRDFSLKMPKKMKLQALVSALSEKNKGNLIFVLDAKLSGKTKELSKFLKSIVPAEKKKERSILFVRTKKDENALIASRNIAKVETVTGSNINTYGVIKNNAVIILKEALGEMKETFLKTS